VKFSIPVINDREFLQWQVAEANFTSEEFWLVFSTQNNDELKKISPIQAGATESQNCLGAYHITKHAEGAHVVITQNVNPHPFFPFPMHQVLSIFPPAWAGTLDFVHQMSENSRKLAAIGSSHNFTDAPPYMLQGPMQSSMQQPDTSPSLKIVGRAEAFPALKPSKASEIGSSFPGSGMFLVIGVLSAVAFAVAGFSVGRLTAGKIDTLISRSRFAQIQSRDTSFDSTASAFHQEHLEGEAFL
jgi:hypothetical protein